MAAAAFLTPRNATSRTQTARWYLIALSAGLLQAVMTALEHAADFPTAATIASPTLHGPASADAGLSRRFSTEILAHLDAAHTLARYLVRDHSVAEDIVQEAFLRAFRAFSGYRGDNPRAWLLAIVRNCHRDWRTEQARMRSTMPGSAPYGNESEDDQLVTIPSSDLSPEEELLRRDEAGRVHAILVIMPEIFREVLVLRDLEDLSYADIAEVIAAPIGTVMSRLARARRLFGRLWLGEPDAGGPEEMA
ncbi:Sigma-24 [Hartmannibacter diazotrophicus]|uniref:RNA polymerase sigma factor n=1 Tax=Hartmannibacter diazotrophicus TaxID=1482074 RepID=A0A2C9D8I1_9HYPH|nr:sigma-70 family RNA polymerase sigma factor [Hartmannibacter diazotrophicus]SON56617.1 Sigma-24 [Hartmannibacter diazotrophicus]